MAQKMDVKYVDGKVYILGEIAGETVWVLLPKGKRVEMGNGSIELKETDRVGLHIVRFSKGGSFKWKHLLKREGYHLLTADGGSMPKFDEEARRKVLSQKAKNPLVGLLHRLGIYKSEDQVVFYSEKTLTFSDGISHTTDGCPRRVNGADVEVSDATYCIWLPNEADAFPLKLFVWPNASLVKIERVIEAYDFFRPPDYEYPLWEKDSYRHEDDPGFKEFAEIYRLKRRVYKVIREDVRPIQLSPGKYCADDSRWYWAALWLLVGLALDSLRKGTKIHSRALRTAFKDVPSLQAQAVLEGLWREVCDFCEESQDDFPPVFSGVRKDWDAVIVERMDVETGEVEDDVIICGEELALAKEMCFSYLDDDSLCYKSRRNRWRLRLPDAMKNYMAHRSEEV